MDEMGSNEMILTVGVFGVSDGNVTQSPLS